MARRSDQKHSQPATRGNKCPECKKRKPKKEWQTGGESFCSRSCRNIAWIEGNVGIPDGPLIGQLVKLAPFQKEWIRGIYDTPTRTAILSFARKNAKTAGCGFLVLLHLVGPEARRNSDLCSAAMAREQAAILFKYCAKMVRLSPNLSGHITIRDTNKQLYCPALGTLYSALSADATTNYGANPAFIVHDELGQVKGERHAMYEALETATGVQQEPLSVIISTQAPTDADLLSLLIDDALTGADPKTKLFLYTTDPEDDDPWDVETIKKANPAFDYFMNQEEVLRMRDKAQRMPSREASYRNLILNQRVEVNSPFVTRSVWQENAGEHEGWGMVYAGLDLSETNDLTALVLVSKANGVWNVKPHFWLPEDGIKERARQDRVPYDVWAEQGYLHLTPGRSIEYSYIAEFLIALLQKERVRKIGFDRWNMRHLRPWMIEGGMPEAVFDDTFVEFGQGYVSMSPALRTTETQLLNQNIRHQNHPVLSMCAANAVVKTDEAGNRKLDKKRSRGRIDGMVALVMGLEVAEADSRDRHVYADASGEAVDPEEFVEDLTDEPRAASGLG